MSRTNKMVAFGGSSDVIKRMDKDFDKSRPVFGIDLGTTNSAISVIAAGDKVECIRLDSGKYTMPSCVMLKDGKFIVGEEAYKNRASSSVIYSVKRHMQKVGKTVVFKESSSKSKELTPAEVSAEILKGLVEKTGGVYGEIKDVVVTVPAYFDQNGRNATREACELAGLNLIDMINEPTAASLCYDISLKGKESEDILIFDFGGGTFDATLARIVDGDGDGTDDIYGFESSDSSRLVSCLGVDGDSALGGDDVDREMFEIICNKVKGRFGYDLHKAPREYREELILRMERLKKTDVNGIYETMINTVLEDGTRVDVSIDFGAEEFRQALIPSYKKCKRIVDDLLASVPNKAKTMILVGGSTKNPHLQEFLHRDYPDFDINDGIGQDLAVTMGASIKGKISKFGDDKIMIFDVLPITIGILDDGHVLPMIEAGTTLPATNSIDFTTVVDNQKEMTVEVMQGKYQDPSRCISLGKMVFTDIPKGAAGEPDLIATITVNTNSMMKCRGSINGVVKEMVLDLTGETSAEAGDDKDERLINRWKKTAEQMDEVSKKTLLKLIEGYPAMCNKKDIMSFIRENTGKLKK